MNAKKIISLLLCLFMLSACALMVGCNGGDDNSSGSNDGGVVGGDTMEDYGVTMPEFKWDGDQYKEFDVLIYSNEAQTTYFCEDVQPDLYTTTDGSLNEAVKRRNDEILSQYGVTVKGHPVKDVAADLKLDISSGTNLYDAALPFMPAAAALAQEGYLWDLKEFDDYIHFDQPWWDQSANKSLTIGNKLFFTTGDISIMPKIVSTAITFNKEILEKNFPEYNLYDMVKNNEWTFDKMLEMSRVVTADTDGTAGLSYKDSWGLSSSYGDVSAFFIAGGKNYISKDDDDLPVISFNDTASTTLIQQILQDLQIKEDWVFHCDEVNDGSDKWVVSLDIFGQNRALFRTSAFSAIKKLRAYDDVQDFGIIPFPLMTEEQDTYYTYCSARMAYGVVIPTSRVEEEAEYSAFMLELMAFGGMKHITPAYYETTLKYRDLRDDESAEMLDNYIFKNVVYDLGIIYDFGGISGMITNLMSQSSANIVSAFEEKENQIQTAIDDCVISYELG